VQPSGAIAHIATDFHRIGVRIRTQNRNHGIVIRSDRLGADGNDGSTYGATGVGKDVHTGNVEVFGPFNDGVRYWKWKQYQGHPEDFKWGLSQDELGVKFWFIHHVDPHYTGYNEGNDVFGNTSETETPLIDDGNPIYYPTWYSPQDSSNWPGLDSVKDNKLGMPATNFWFEMSDDPFTGAPPFWPNRYQVHTPRGYAMMTTGSEGQHIFTAI